MGGASASVSTFDSKMKIHVIALRGKPKCTMKLMIIIMSLIVDNSEVKVVPNRPLKVMMIVWNVIKSITGTHK